MPLGLDLASFPSVEALLDAAFDKGTAKSIEVKKEDDRRIASVTTGAIINWVDSSKPATKVFIKQIMPDTLAATYNDLLHIYDKETSFYREFMPKMEQFQADRGIPFDKRVGRLFPQFVAAGCVEGSYVLALEDIMTEGYKVTGKTELHSQEQIKTAFHRLGQYHATTHAMQVKASEHKWLKDFLTLDKDVILSFASTPSKAYLYLTKLAVQAKLEGLACANDLKVPKSVTPALVEELMKLSDEFPSIFPATRTADSGPFGVVSHGDFHMWNMAFKEDAAGSLVVKFFDLQIVNFSSFACDMHHYLCQVSTAAERDEHLDSWLQIYLDAFQERCKALGYQPPSQFNLDEMKKEYVKRSPMAFMFSFPHLMIRFITDSEAEKVARDDSKELKERAEALFKSGAEIKTILQIYIDNVDHYNKLGTYGVMREMAAK